MPVSKKKVSLETRVLKELASLGRMLSQSVPVPSVPHTFDPNSFDSQFADIHSTLRAQDSSRNARMDSQDLKLGAVLEQTTKTNGRVTKSEGEIEAIKNQRKVERAYVAGAAAAGALIVQILFHFWK